MSTGAPPKFLTAGEQAAIGLVVEGRFFRGRMGLGPKASTDQRTLSEELRDRWALQPAQAWTAVVVSDVRRAVRAVVAEMPARADQLPRILDEVCSSRVVRETIALWGGIERLARAAGWTPVHVGEAPAPPDPKNPSNDVHDGGCEGNAGDRTEGAEGGEPTHVGVVIAPGTPRVHGAPTPIGWIEPPHPGDLQIRATLPRDHPAWALHGRASCGCPATRTDRGAPWHIAHVDPCPASSPVQDPRRVALQVAAAMPGGGWPRSYRIHCSCSPAGVEGTFTSIADVERVEDAYRQAHAACAYITVEFTDEVPS